MSKKSYFKGFGKKKEQDPIPRPLAEIQKVYGELSARAGQLQYQSYIIGKDLEQVNQALISVNHEAAARQKLDKEAAATTEGSAQ